MGRNRVHKVLEDANVKLGDVLSDVFCVSGRLMLQALLDGELSPDQIAELAKRRHKLNSLLVAACLRCVWLALCRARDGQFYANIIAR